MPDFAPNLVDPIDLDRIRGGDTLALTDALYRLHQGTNDSIAFLRQIMAQSQLTPIYCRLYRHLTTQTVADSTSTPLAWETPPEPGNVIEGANVGGMFDPVVGATFITLGEPGLYLIEAHCLWDTNTVGDRTLEISLPGVPDNVDRVRTSASTPSAQGTRQSVQSLVPWRSLTTSLGGWSGRVTILAYQDSGSPRTVGGAAGFYDHWFACTRVGNLR
jgi:hypothetical protein